MTLSNKETGTEINPLIIFGRDSDTNVLFSYMANEIDQGTLCYCTMALISLFFDKCFDVKLTETEKVQRTMPYLEKMLLRFPIEFSMETKETEAAENAEDEILRRLRDRVPPEMRELIDKRRNK